MDFKNKLLEVKITFLIQNEDQKDDKKLETEII